MVGFNWTATMARSCNKRVCLADSLDISCPFTCDCSQVTQDDWIDVFTEAVLDKIETEDMG